MNILAYIVGALWFFLPAGAANAAPVVLTKIPLLKGWAAALDCGLTYKAKRLLGNNKTWRGLIGGSLIGGLTGLLQYYVLSYKIIGSPMVTTAVAAFFIGLLLGFGALFGDAIESLLKRQLGIKPGDGWFPFDQIDYIIGGLLISYPLTHVSWKLMLAVVFTWFGVHLAVVYCAYLAGLRDKPI